MTTITHGQKGAGWAIDDTVMRLRRWGRRDCFELPSSIATVSIGAAEGAGLRVQDDLGSVSRQHAMLTREGEIWTIRDLGSKNGTRQDGERRLSFALTPGVELEVGEVKLIAESARLIALHRFLSRIIGWSDERLPDVDSALRGVRDMGARRTALMLCGAGNLIPTARRLHELAHGSDRPFLVVENSVAAALETVAAGTLCVPADRLPDDLALTRAPSASSALIICARTRADAAEALGLVERAAIVELPALDTRSEERDQLIREYANDAVRMLGAPSTGFREHELYWLRDVVLMCLDDISELMLRLVAQRNFGVTHGAAKLGITHAALATYLRRRGIPL